MTGKSFWIALGVVIVLTASGTVLNGRISNRWGPSQSMIEAGIRLRQLPIDVVAWDFLSSTELAETTRAMLECTGDISRSYASTTSKAAVGYTLLVGPPGPTAAHSPEICFPARNYRLLGERKRVHVRDARGMEHEFWMVAFQSQGLDGRILHVYYGWTIGGRWSAPDNPRFEYPGSPYLYKLQLIGYPSLVATNESQDPVPVFLSALLPSIPSVLLSAASTP